MGRLYYEKPENLSATREIGVEATKVTSNDYLEKVSKLVPSEVIAGYLAMFGFVAGIQKPETHKFVMWAIFGLCQILTPIYLNNQAEAGKPKRNHLIISSVAFAVWAYATTGDKLFPESYSAAFGSIFLVAFSLVSAIIPLNE